MKANERWKGSFIMCWRSRRKLFEVYFGNFNLSYTFSFYIAVDYTEEGSAVNNNYKYTTTYIIVLNNVFYPFLITYPPLYLQTDKKHPS